jgi:hypothetical protein
MSHHQFCICSVSFSEDPVKCPAGSGDLPLYFEDFKKEKRMKWITRNSVLVLAITLGAAINAYAISNYTGQFNAYYGTTGGYDYQPILGSCLTCHPSGSTRNAYANDWSNNSHNFASVEALDSDLDGVSNIAEIDAGTFPGDPNSKPVIANNPPTANAGPDKTVNEGATVILSGSNSSDPGGLIVSYLWTQTGGSSVTLSSATVAQPTFTAPIVGPGGASLTFQLTVTDNGGLQATDACVVNATWVNMAPTADAGPDQTVNEGITVALDGSGSNDPDDGIATYHWTQTSGPLVTLSNPSVVNPTFISPSVQGGGASLMFTLTVTGGSGQIATDTCFVNVSWDNLPPTADAGTLQAVTEGATVTLDGSGSVDPDDGIASHLWSQNGGPPVTLSDAGSIQPTFVTPIVDIGGATLTFTLTVTDHGGLMAGSQVSIAVNDNGIEGFPADALTALTFAGEPFGITENNGGCFTRLDAIDPATMPEIAAEPQNMLFGLIDMEIKVASPGDTTTVTIFLPTPVPPEHKWYKYTASRGWTDYSGYAAFNENRDQVTLTLTDGGAGDDDGVVNGVIVDPSGPGVAPLSSSSSTTSGDWGGGGGCFITAAGCESVVAPSAKRRTALRDLLLRLGLAD